jgi:RNA polymerase sigma-70 factor (ECF subfamily)
LETQTDEQLVHALQLGDREAFDALYRRYSEHIYAFCLKLTGAHSLAEDVTHDTFVSLYRNIDELHDANRFHSWLFTIARNNIYNQLRHSRRNGFLDVESVWDDETPFSLVEQADAKEIVSNCIGKLKIEYREVLFLREFEQRSYEEIADITGTTQSSVKSRLFKARRALTEKLIPYFKE